MSSNIRIAYRKVMEFEDSRCAESENEINVPREKLV